jgi:5-methylcytosine-specific restriction endonuclease McrA
MKKQRTTDHRIPLSRGGDNTLENLVACCKDCNQRKDNMTDVEFLSLLESERAHSSMAEQGTHNPLVLGSNPSGPTNLIP